MFGLSENRNGFGTFSGPNGSGSVFSSGNTAWVSGTNGHDGMYTVRTAPRARSLATSRSRGRVPKLSDPFGTRRGHKHYGRSMNALYPR